MPDPKYLYKYRAIDLENPQFARRIFTHRELYFSHVDQFNDPFDCRYKFDFFSTEKELKDYFVRSLKYSKSKMTRGDRRKWIKEKVSRKKLESEPFVEAIEKATKNYSTQLRSAA
ncbi:MAG: hypothetical protein VW268_01140 [Rhodospirillaceae bacterium]